MHVDLLQDLPPQVLSPARRFGGKRCEFGRGPSWLCPGNVAGQARGGGVRCPSVPWCDKSPCAIGIVPAAPSLRAERRMAPACANPACPHPARVSWDTGGSCPQGLWAMGRGRGSPKPTAGCTVASPPSRREGKQAPRNLVSSPTPLVTISMVMELRKPYCRAGPVLSSPCSRARARWGHEAEGCAPWDAACLLPQAWQSLHHAAGSHRGWGKPGMSSGHSSSASLASLIPLPAPRVAAALLSSLPPPILSLSRDSPLAQSLMLVPEKSYKIAAALSCSRILASSQASSSYYSWLSPHLRASHRSPQHEGDSLEPPTATHEAKSGLGRERKMGCMPCHRAAFCCICIPHHH